MKILIGSTVADTYDSTEVIIKTGVLAGYSEGSGYSRGTRTSLATKQVQDLALAIRDTVSKTNSKH